MSKSADFAMNDRPELSLNTLEEHRFNLNSRGYSICNGFLSLSECEYLKDKIKTALESYKVSEGSTRSDLDRYHIHDLMCRDLMFGKLLEDPRLDQLMAILLDKYWIMYAATSSSVPPRGENYARRVHKDCARFYKDYVFNAGVIWVLDDYMVNNGALEVLPGSHNVDTIPTVEIFEKYSVDVLCDAGSLIIFNSNLYHRTKVNHTDRWRHSMTLNACRPFMKQRMDWVRFIPEDIASNLNERARRIIGYDTRLPTSLEELFVPEVDRLYKANQG